MQRGERTSVRLGDGPAMAAPLRVTLARSRRVRREWHDCPPPETARELYRLSRTVHMHQAHLFTGWAREAVRECLEAYWRRNAARELQAARLAHRLVMGRSVPPG